MKSQVVYTVWSYVSGEAAGKFELIPLESERIKLTLSLKVTDGWDAVLQRPLSRPFQAV